MIVTKRTVVKTNIKEEISRLVLLVKPLLFINIIQYYKVFLNLRNLITIINLTCIPVTYLISINISFFAYNNYNCDVFFIKNFNTSIGFLLNFSY